MTALLAVMLLGACGQAEEADAAEESAVTAGQEETAGTEETSTASDVTYTKDSRIGDVMEDPVFGSYGRLLFPTDESYYSGDTLGELDLTWYNDINPDKTVEIVNTLHDRAADGEQIFFDIYTEEEKEEDPDKNDTGLFFFRGSPGAKTAIVSAGGGFAYVGAMQDSFPVALELSKMGYNAFALIYRPDSQTACEDLSRAVAWLSENAELLDIDMTDYSLWGGSAGARMADWVGTNGTTAYGEAEYPQPAIVVTQYTGLSEVTGNEPPTYANVGTSDGIADYRTMEDRIARIQANGTDAQIQVFEGLPHGFGLGEGTVAEGWVNEAVSFWEAHMTTENTTGQEQTEETNAPAVEIPDAIEEIPDGYTGEAEEQGTLEDLYYDTWESFSYAEQSQKLEKHAVVYLPYGYDPEQEYDVFYLMHGGWSNENTTLGTTDAPSEFKNILDHAIQDGQIRPLIVVCPTYNNTNENGQDSDSFSLAMQLTDNYHNELLNDLMPAVEGTYHTYAEDTTPEAFAASRDHRGFGGFSMGSVTTWHTFQYDLDYFRYFLPMSCGTSLDDDAIWQAAEGRDSGDYFVFVMTGTDDFAYSYDTDRTDRMEDSPYFASVDEAGEEGNYAFRVMDGCSHDGTAAMTYTWNGMRAFFHP